MLPSYDNYFHTKQLRYHLILFRDIDDQRILQIDYTRDTPDHTHLKAKDERLYVPLMAIVMQEKESVDSFQRYW